MNSLVDIINQLQNIPRLKLLMKNMDIIDNDFFDEHAYDGLIHSHQNHFIINIVIYMPSSYSLKIQNTI